REQLAAQLRDLEAKKEAASHRLEEVRKASAQAWTHMKSGMDMASDDLRHAYQQARKVLEAGLR
ncbi:MAG: hypothetical protein P8182_03825, partial [Deltaproteobacteria bacterium]